MSEPLPLLWCDIETTGLDINRDELLEVACFTTDPSGENVRTPRVWTIHIDSYGEKRLQNNEFVLNMHQNSGLLDECRNSDLGLGMFFNGFGEYIFAEKAHYGVEQLTMAGSGVGPFDLPFLKSRYPILGDALTYYVMDVGVIGRFIRNVCGFQLPERPTVDHRALDDIHEHYQEFLQYKGMLEEHYQLANR